MLFHVCKNLHYNSYTRNTLVGVCDECYEYFLVVVAAELTLLYFLVVISHPSSSSSPRF
jgi:hypothetical protein